MEAFPIPRVEGGGKGWSRSRSCLYTLACAWSLLSSPTRGQCPGPGGARQPGPDPVPSRAQAAASGQWAVCYQRDEKTVAGAAHSQAQITTPSTL